MEKKIGLFVRVNRDDASDYFNEHSAEFKGKEFQSVQKEITSMLSARKLDQQLAQYLSELKSKAKIRLNP